MVYTKTLINVKHTTKGYGNLVILHTNIVVVFNMKTKNNSKTLNTKSPPQTLHI